MASITKYQTKTGHAWRVQYRSPDGKNRTKRGFRTKALALTWAAKNTVDVTTGQWTDPNKAKIILNDIGTAWLQHQTHLKPSTYRVVEQSWRVHVQPRWGNHQIGTIKPSAVQEWVASMDRSASTVRKAHACLSQILDTAVQDGMIKMNPARGVRLPRKAKGKHVYLTATQVGELAGECSVHSEIVWVLATTGIRWGELAALRVQDVDFLRRRLHIVRNAVTVGSQVHVGTPKTHERRTVAIPAFVLDMLAPLCVGKAREELLWARTDGDYMRVPSSNTWYYGALKRTMERDRDFPRVTIHGLRHVAAGLLVSQGANVKVVQRQLGHASAVMTLDTYSDLFDEDLDAVGNLMDEAFRNAVKMQSAGQFS